MIQNKIKPEASIYKIDNKKEKFQYIREAFRNLTKRLYDHKRDILQLIDLLFLTALWVISYLG